MLKAVSIIAQKLASWQGKPSTLNTDKYNIMKQRNWRCDISEMQNVLGFTPQYSLEKGVKETIAWYKENGWI